MLSEREIEFLAVAARGRSRQQIADECYASPWTVKMYLARARDTLGARNTAEAVVKAISIGAIFVDDNGVAHVDVPLPPSLAA